MQATEYDPDSEWRKVETGGKTGYMMEKYLRSAEGERETVEVPRETPETWVDAMENYL